MSNIEERVRNIIVEQLGVQLEEVKNEASFVDDLGADSSSILRSLMKKLKKLLQFNQQSITLLTTVNHSLLNDK